MFYRIDPALARSLEILHVSQRKAPYSRAAMALWSWYLKTGPGRLLRASRSRFREETHIDEKKILPGFQLSCSEAAGSTVKVLIFTDRSAVVLLDRKQTPDEVEVLPITFHLHEKHHNPMLMIRAGSDPCHTTNARLLLVPPGTVRPDWDHRTAYTEEEIDGSEALRTHPALEALRRDIGRLRPLFDEPSWIAAPNDGPLPEGKVDATAQSRLMLPVEARGGRVSWVRGLPYKLTRQEDALNMRRFFEDLISYVGHVYADRLSGLRFSVDLSTGEDGGPLIMMHGYKESTPRSVGFDVAHVLENPESRLLPVPPERLKGLAFHNFNRMKQRVGRVKLCEGGPRKLSNHELLEISGRFGPLRQGLFT